MGGWGQYGFGFSLSGGGYDSIAALASPTFTLTWVPDAGKDLHSDPPPKTVSLLETGSALGYASGGILNSPDLPNYDVSGAAADDGLGDPALGEPQTVIADASQPDSVISLNKFSHGGHLHQYDGSSGSITITPSVSAVGAVSGINSSDWRQWEDVEASLGFHITPDTRTVKISDPTNMKAPAYNSDGSVSFDANGDQNFVPAPHTDVNGVMYGDTIYCYLDTLTGNEANNWQYFSSIFGGDWHYKPGHDHDGNSEDVPDVVDPDTWHWSPNESEDYWDFGKCLMPDAQNFWEEAGKPYGQGDAPREYDVTYTATDNTDGATATAQYIMTVHDPYERNYSDHMHPGIENVRQAPNAQYIRATQDGQDLVVYAEQGDTWSVGASAEGPVSAWLAETLGVNLEASASYTINTGQSVTVKDVMAGYATYLEEFDAYKYHVGKADTWATNGYMGTNPYAFKEPDSPCGGFQAHMPLVYLGNSTGP